MTTLPTLHTAVHDLEGDLVLMLNPASGYRRLSVTGNAGAIYTDNLTDGPYVEGAAEVTPARKAALKRVERIKVKGTPGLTGEAYWASLEDRIDALIAAVSSQFVWVVGLGGYHYSYRTVGPASVDASVFEREHLAQRMRLVTMSFTVQPNPTRALPED